MTKLDKLVSHSIYKLLLPVFGFIIMSVCGVLWAQTADMIKDNKTMIAKNCDETDKHLDEKVDKVDLDRTLKYMEKNSDRQWEAVKELMDRSETIDTKVEIIQRDVNDIKRKLR